MAVLNESTYKEKISSLLYSCIYEHLCKDPTSEIQRKICKVLSKYKTVHPITLKHKLTPYHGKPSHLPKKYKNTSIPLRPIMSSIDLPYLIFYIKS
jgi:hypothetical protein